MGDVVELYTDDGGAGDGLPVVFLHSLAGDGRQWEAQLAHLRPHRRAVAIDWRGHGRSPAGDGDWRVETLAGDVAAAVDRLGVERFVLVGHSAGGSVAIAYAGAHPERVAGLLLLDAAGDSRGFPREMIDPFLDALDAEASYAKTIEGYWGTIAGSDPAVRERLMADLRGTRREAAAGVFRSTTRFDPGAWLARYPGPRLSVVTPRNTGPHSLRALDPAMPHVTVTGTGHWIQLDRPDELDRILDGFLETVEAAG